MFDVVIIVVVFILVYIVFVKPNTQNKKDVNKVSDPEPKKEKLSREELIKIGKDRASTKESLSLRDKHEWKPADDSALKKEDTFEIKDTPDGYEVYENQSYFVQGVTFRFDACLTWAKGKNHKIAFKREPKNKHDENAIAVYGISSSGRRKIGYVAAEIADDLVYRKLDDKIAARLLSVKITEAPFIEYEILVESKAYLDSE